MSVTFKKAAPNSVAWHLIELSSEASFEVAIRKPTLAEQLAAMDGSDTASVREMRMKSSIVDWRGVSDEAGQPVPYSWENLNLLCEGYQNAVWDLLSAVSRALFAETPVKNSETPPPAGGTETTTETTASTASSETTTTSDASNDSAEPPG